MSELRELRENTNRIQISRSRLEELEYIEKHYDEIITNTVIEKIEYESLQKNEKRRLKKEEQKRIQAELLTLKMHSYFHGVRNNVVENVEEYLQTDGDPNVRDSETEETGLMIAVKKGHFDIAKKLLEHNANPDLQDASGMTALYIACTENRHGFVKLLLENKANPNIADNCEKSPLHVAVNNDSLQIVKDLLKYGADMLVMDECEMYPMDITQSSEMENVLEAHKKTIRVWKGRSREDVSVMDTIFGDQATNYSFCPICLKHVERNAGCIYMSHDCASEGRVYHKELYEKYAYSNELAEGCKIVQWCTICNRITQKERHLQMVDFTAPVGKQCPAGNMFESDCKLSSGGGGILEKKARFIQLRNKIKELNDYAGNLSESNAVKQMAEAMWNAPFVIPKNSKDLRANKWKYENDCFPLQHELDTKCAVEEDEDVHEDDDDADPDRPMSDSYILPTFYDPGFNCVSYDETYRLIRFTHRMANGEMHRHKQCINIHTLKKFLTLAIQEYKSGINLESLGFCWLRTGGCTAKLHPEEIVHVFNRLGNKSPEELQLLDDYTTLYNKKFADA